MTERDTERSGESPAARGASAGVTGQSTGITSDNFVWVLAVGLFALGALSLFLSFDGEPVLPLDTTASANGEGVPTIDTDGDGVLDTPVADDEATSDGLGTAAANRFTISASGDILIHERVAEAATTAEGAFDFAPLFNPVRDLIATRDFAICHLEVPLSSTNDDLAFTDGTFRVPMELADAIQGVGFDSCSVASNHAWDSGETSVTSTIAQLERVGLPHVGIANSPEDAAKSWQFNVLGNTIGHLSYTFALNGREPGEVPQDRVAQIDEAAILADAARQRELGSEFTIVSMHWGSEFQNEPDALQADLGPRLLASPDIDLIIGHHAHVPQQVVEINGEYIAYGLGNLLSNQAQGIPECPTACPVDSQDGVLIDFVVERTAEGALAVTDVVANPTWVDNRNTWAIIPTDSPPAVGFALDAQLLSASGERTRASLGIE